MLKETPFLDKTRWLLENELAFAVFDNYPVSVGHLLVLPKRVVPYFTDLTEEEVSACFRLVRDYINTGGFFKEASGFNIGINMGEVAGQTVGHCHIHVIPRYEGDHPNPRGGVRAVIPGKADYK